MAEKERVGAAIAATLNVRKGFKLGGVAVTATAADLNMVSGVAATGSVKKVVKVPLAAVDTAGGVFAWANPEAGPVVVNRITLDVTTAATGACTLDIGPAANATTLNDTLIDGADVHTAVVTGDNVSLAGSNGLGLARRASGAFITGSTASGAAAGLVGFVYIEYFLV